MLRQCLLAGCTLQPLSCKAPLPGKSGQKLKKPTIDIIIGIIIILAALIISITIILIEIIPFSGEPYVSIIDQRDERDPDLPDHHVRSRVKRFGLVGETASLMQNEASRYGKRRPTPFNAPDQHADRRFGWRSVDGHDCQSAKAASTKLQYLA